MGQNFEPVQVLRSDNPQGDLNGPSIEVQHVTPGKRKIASGCKAMTLAIVQSNGHGLEVRGQGDSACPEKLHDVTDKLTAQCLTVC